MLTSNQYAQLANFALAAVSMAKDEDAKDEFKVVAVSFLQVCDESFGSQFLIDCLQIRDGGIKQDFSPSYLAAILAVSIANRKDIDAGHLKTVVQAFVYSLQKDSGLSTDEFARLAQISTRNKPTLH